MQKIEFAAKLERLNFQNMDKYERELGTILPCHKRHQTIHADGREPLSSD